MEFNFEGPGFHFRFRIWAAGLAIVLFYASIFHLWSVARESGAVTAEDLWTAATAIVGLRALCPPAASSISWFGHIVSGFF